MKPGQIITENSTWFYELRINVNFQYLFLYTVAGPLDASSLFLKTALAYTSR